VKYVIKNTCSQK